MGIGDASSAHPGTQGTPGQEGDGGDDQAGDHNVLNLTYDTLELLHVIAEPIADGVSQPHRSDDAHRGIVGRRALAKLPGPGEAPAYFPYFL